MSEYDWFYLTFTAQIILLSVFIPTTALSRMKFVIAHYPRITYPKLYPYSDDEYKKGQNTFKFANAVIVTLGVLFLISQITGNISLNLKALGLVSPVYFLLQLVPFMLLEHSDKSSLKAMRLLNDNNKRSASFNRRSVFDYIKPSMIWLALGLIAATIIIDVYLFNLVGAQSGAYPEQPWLRALVLIITNLGLAFVVYINLYGKKLNPLQDDNDRELQISKVVKSITYISMGMSLYFIVQSFVNHFGAEHYQAAITSFYCCVIGYFSAGAPFAKSNIDNNNFEVYK